MKAKKIMDETTNRYEYNRVRKRYLEGREIDCSYCKYHKGDNCDHKWYGKNSSGDSLRYPNWKLVSKNKKQWIKKPMKIKEVITTYHNYIEITF